MHRSSARSEVLALREFEGYDTRFARRDSADQFRHWWVVADEVLRSAGQIGKLRGLGVDA